MRAKIQLVPPDGADCHAGAKAPRDAAAIADRSGYRRLSVRRPLPPVAALSVPYLALWLAKALVFFFRIPRGALVFLQCTDAMFTGRMSLTMLRLLRKLRRVRFVTLIHDVDVLRGRARAEDRTGLDRRLRQFVRMSDILIVHNAVMEKWFEDRGVPANRLVVLGLFDYLAPAVADRQPEFSNEIVVAGNLSPKKAAYLSRLPTIPGLKWNLYGPECDGAVADGIRIRHCGCHAPEELPAVLRGSWGLVWDGDTVETCRGTMGGYLKYNNPHKLSLYLAAGLPVIVWRKSALAEYVRSNRLGLCVDSLRDIPAALAELDGNAYGRMCRNVRAVSARLLAGACLEAALRKAESVIC